MLLSLWCLGGLKDYGCRCIAVSLRSYAHSAPTIPPRRNRVSCLNSCCDATGASRRTTESV